VATGSAPIVSTTGYVGLSSQTQKARLPLLQGEAQASAMSGINATITKKAPQRPRNKQSERSSASYSTIHSSFHAGVRFRLVGRCVRGDCLSAHNLSSRLSLSPFPQQPSFFDVFVHPLFSRLQLLQSSSSSWVVVTLIVSELVTRG
jgi:hypothetical protein